MILFQNAAEGVSKETEMIRILQKQADEEFSAARQKSGFRFTGEQVRFITYLMDKYGDDFKVRGHSNNT